MEVTLSQKHEEVPGVMTFILQPEEPLIWQAGQYAVYNLPHDNPDQEGTERFFTIASAPFEEYLQITTRVTTSTFKKTLAGLATGQTFELKKTGGSFTLPQPESDQQYVFIAGGIGITPFHSILLDLDHNGEAMDIDLLYANRDQNLIFGEQLRGLADKHQDFKLHSVIDPERIDEQHVREIAPDITRPVFYISGPEPMVQAMEKMLAGLGVADEKMKRDYFPGYDWPEANVKVE